MPEVVGQQVVDKENEEGSYRHAATYLADKFCQLIQLDVQRRLHTRQLSSLASHMTYLRLVANSRHHIAASATHHHR